jgi:hypothetical protein
MKRRKSQEKKIKAWAWVDKNGNIAWHTIAGTPLRTFIISEQTDLRITNLTTKEAAKYKVVPVEISILPR